MLDGRTFVAFLLTGSVLTLPPIAKGQDAPEAAAAAESEPEDSPAQRALAALTLPDGFTATLFAAEPMVANPVAFCFDERGRMYVAETYRQERGVEDNREQPYWLLDDLALQTVQDRARMYEKWAHRRVNGLAHYTTYEDRIVRLSDTDGDGVADVSEIFADGFNRLLEGTGAGVLAYRGDVYYTNIPNLWLLRDADGDGRAEFRASLLYGFGVRTALRGHDMHGLTLGPDGKLYWSIGDRGYHVETPEGRVLHSPGSGAVFRANLDGSDLEVFHHGLRNPQELAFDDFGNLFTGDNNSDAGDRARLVYCVDGGETGWSMNFQTLEGANLRGPWNQEGLWHLQHEGQPAWILPPVAHIAAGPSGLVHYPGVGLPDGYDGHFFLCDFRGGASHSAVLTFAVKPRGASFEMVNARPFVGNVLCTDVDFGCDGRMYVLDWVATWVGTGEGRVYAIEHPEARAASAADAVARLLAEGFEGRSIDELTALLRHDDQRVRLRAQYALAARREKAIEALDNVARDETHRLARLHAIWGLGMIARDRALPAGRDPLAVVADLLSDADPEVRSQAAKTIGECGYEPAGEALIDLLFDDDVRPRYFAAIALGRLKYKPAIEHLVTMLWENADRDVYLRHAGVMGLWRMDDLDAVLNYATDASPAVRLAVLLVLRREADPRVAMFLRDEDEFLVTEAARAINDVPIPDAMPALAGLIEPNLSVDETPEPPMQAYEFRREFFLNASSAVPATVNTPPAEPVGESIEGVIAASAPDASNSPTARADRDAATAVGVPEWPGPVELTIDDHPIFDRAPDQADSIDHFAGRVNFADDFATRITATIIAPQTGEYVFHLCSDDDSALYVSVTGDPAEKRKVAFVDGWVSQNVWDQQPTQSSEPIRLERGQPVYLEVRHLEVAGGDHVAVGWTMPDGTRERPIGVGPEVEGNEPLLRRVINANLRLGRRHHAEALADLARDASAPLSMRRESLDALADWVDPSPRDRVIGSYRPVDKATRDPEAIHDVLRRKLPGLIEHAAGSIRTRARQLANRYEVPLDNRANFEAAMDASLPVEDRMQALVQLSRDRDERFNRAIEAALASEAPALRAKARELLVSFNPEQALAEIRVALQSGSLLEQRSALAALSRIEGPDAEAILLAHLRAVVNGEARPELALDVVEAATARHTDHLTSILHEWQSSFDPSDPLAPHRITLHGGDAEAGRRLFLDDTAVSCVRCHAVRGVGGIAGPDLTNVGARLTREELLESLVNPSAVMAEGFTAPSAMPAAVDHLSPREIRDLIEYLSTLK